LHSKAVGWNVGEKNRTKALCAADWGFSNPKDGACHRRSSCRLLNTGFAFTKILANII
jgi:hypothetical protein